MTIHQASQQLIFQLFHLYTEREARNIADLVMENVTEWKRIDRIVNKEVTLSAEKEKLLLKYTAELMESKPVQYVLQEAWFYGMKFYVDENVLIPRPETEELVQWVLSEAVGYTPGLEKTSILDIGTGSGCIAVSLKKKLAEARIFACDTSQKAIEVAKMNAKNHNTSIDFIAGDFLQEQHRNLLPVVDIIVSNPPYIPLNNKENMESNVINYEPHLALFVMDNDPLLFYRAMAEFCQTHLSKQGTIFVEIHEEFSKAVEHLFLLNGFNNIELRKDLQGRERMVRASRE